MTKAIKVKNTEDIQAINSIVTEFPFDIWIHGKSGMVDAKSLLGILSLGIVGGAKIRIIADGSDEQLAVDGLVKLVEGGFSE